MASLEQKKKLAQLLKKLGSPEAGAIETALIEIEKMRGSIPSPVDVSPIYREMQSLTAMFKKFENMVASLSDGLVSKLSKEEMTQLDETVKQTKNELTKSIDELRLETLQKFASRGGGSPNRQIKIGGVDYLTRYTDINLIGSITAVNNNAQRRVDITFSSGSTYQNPTSGALGQGTFTWATAPSIIYVDGVPKQKTQSDGTVNWTGTTTTVLTLWPSFDIFGL